MKQKRGQLHLFLMLSFYPWHLQSSGSTVTSFVTLGISLSLSEAASSLRWEQQHLATNDVSKDLWERETAWGRKQRKQKGRKRQKKSDRLTQRRGRGRQANTQRLKKKCIGHKFHSMSKSPQARDAIQPEKVNLCCETYDFQHFPTINGHPANEW